MRAENCRGVASSWMSVTSKWLIASQPFRNANRNTVCHTPKTTYNGGSRHVRTTKSSTYSLYDVDVFGKLDADMKQISAEEIKRQSEEKISSTPLYSYRRGDVGLNES